MVRQRRAVEPMARIPPDSEDCDDGVRDLLLVKCYSGEMGRAVAVRVNTRSRGAIQWHFPHFGQFFGRFFCPFSESC